jgi:hypothetical protein
MKADTISGHDVIIHAQKIVCNGVITVLPRDFGIRHIGITKYRRLRSPIFISLKWHNVHKQYHENQSSYSHFIACMQTDISGDVIHQAGFHQGR